jgi:hypothetical protein
MEPAPQLGVESFDRPLSDAGDPRPRVMEGARELSLVVGERGLDEQHVPARSI